MPVFCREITRSITSTHITCSTMFSKIFCVWMIFYFFICFSYCIYKLIFVINFNFLISICCYS